jgi:hypothetical protein
MGLLGKLFGQKDQGDAADDRRVDAMVARVIELNPRLRLAQRCESRLKSAVHAALHHLDELVGTFPDAHAANAAALRVPPEVGRPRGAAPPR